VIGSLAGTPGGRGNMRDLSSLCILLKLFTVTFYSDVSRAMIFSTNFS
jgi:hypothetical protein